MPVNWTQLVPFPVLLSTFCSLSVAVPDGLNLAGLQGGVTGSKTAPQLNVTFTVSEVYHQDSSLLAVFEMSVA